MKSECKKFGFTLIEVMIAASIIALMAAMVIVYLNKTDPQKELSSNKITMMSVLELARNYAMTGYENTTGNNGYGFFIELDSFDPTLSNEYLVYADVGTIDNRYDVDDEILHEYTMDDNIYVATCNYLSMQVDCDIFFSLYEANVFINSVEAEDEIDINVEYDGSSETSQIHMNGLSGMIK